MSRTICQVCGCESYRVVNEVHNGICDYCAVDEFNKKRQENTKTMPTLPIIAVFYSPEAFFQFEYADHTRSAFRRHNDVGFLELADTMTYEEWMCLQRAIKNPNQWTAVEK